MMISSLALAGAGCDRSPLFPDMGGQAPPPPPMPKDASASMIENTPPDAALPGRTLVWRDEFDGAAGSPPDPGKWDFDVGGSGWGNQQLEYDTDRTSNVSLDGNGHLVITARAEPYLGKSYTSGRIETLAHFVQQYGRFEARMQVPRGQGMWPAFWLLGANHASVGWPQCGEIDVVETKGQEPNLVHGTIHGPGYSGAHGITAQQIVPGAPLADGFHVYAIEWLAGHIVFSVDGATYFSITPAQIPPGTQWVFDAPFGVILDLAVGGNFVGSPDGTTPFPQSLIVDYVRVYEALK
jgi:beta-glucanase (GH16 family)